jgi:hypothetical protein
MRVKLSYTVDEEDILKEAAKILGLSQDDMMHGIEMFKLIPAELLQVQETPNVQKVLDMIEDFRQALLAVDTRLVEVEEIIRAFEIHRAKQRKEGATPELEPDYYGAD